MAKRVFFPVLMLIGLALAGVSLVYLKPVSTYAQDDGSEHNPAALRGAALYAEFCRACHGPQGEAIADNPAFHEITNFDPNVAKGRINQGYDSDPGNDIMMIGYGDDDNGPLSSIQIDDILVYMSTWTDPEAETPELPEPHLAPGENDATGPGDAEHGAIIYASYCLGCHGLNAQGRGLDNFPAFEINENSKRIAERGEGHDSVPAFSAELGGPLTSTDLDDLDAYLKSIDAEEESDQPEGVSILLIILGLGAVAAVGGVYVANQRGLYKSA